MDFGLSIDSETTGLTESTNFLGLDRSGLNENTKTTMSKLFPNIRSRNEWIVVTEIDVACLDVLNVTCVVLNLLLAALMHIWWKVLIWLEGGWIAYLKIYKSTRAIWLVWQIVKYKLALALQGLQATYPTILVAMITRHATSMLLLTKSSQICYSKELH